MGIYLGLRLVARRNYVIAFCVPHPPVLVCGMNVDWSHQWGGEEGMGGEGRGEGFRAVALGIGDGVRFSEVFGSRVFFVV